jgi:Cyclin, N-terminal domain
MAVASWLVELGAALSEHPQTPHMAMAYFDTFMRRRSGLAASDGRRGHGVQLVAAACFMMASKIAEKYVPEVAEISMLTAGACTGADIVSAELVVCGELNYTLCVRTVVDIVPHLCDVAVGAVEMEEADGGGRELGNVGRVVRFDDGVDLVAHEMMANEDGEGGDDVGDSDTVKKDRSCELRTRALAFADLALHCHGLSERYSLGDIAAACVVLARCDVEGCERFGRMWMPIFDRAGLKFGDVVAAAGLILRTWQRLALTRLAAERQVSQVAVASAATANIGSPVSTGRIDDAWWSSEGREMFDGKLEALFCTLPSPAAARVRAAVAAEVNCRRNERQRVVVSADAARNAYVLSKHEGVLWRPDLRPRELLDVLCSLTTCSYKNTISCGRARRRPLSDIVENEFVTQSATLLASSGKRSMSETKHDPGARKSIAKPCFSRVPFPDAEENALGTRRRTSLRIRAQTNSRRATLRSASAPPAKRTCDAGSTYLRY